MTDIRVLHVPYTYWPDPVGGTEHFVRSLAKELNAYDIQSVIAAPSSSSNNTLLDGLEIFRFRIGKLPGAAEGVADFIAAEEFQKILKCTTPDIVHLHARSAAVSELLLLAAHANGARTVVTYHSPTVSCVRGTLLLNGKDPCDGQLKPSRCAACVLRHHGVLAPLAKLLAKFPTSIGTALARVGLRRKLWLALRMRQVVESNIAGFDRYLNEADLVVAPCRWVAKLLLDNGLDSRRLRLCRQGLTHPLPPSTSDTHSLDPAPASVLRLGCFTRLDPTKGLDFLVRALLRIPHAPIELSIHGVAQQGCQTWLDKLQFLAATDPRIHFLPPLPADQVLAVMAQLDLVIVPSVGMETGPLVVLEAWAARTPVLGADRGGISELVRSGVDGLLLPPGDLQAWADALAGLAADPAPLRKWKQAIRAPRSMATVAEEMASWYLQLVVK